jgi:asparagine synthase (glutamine-hydrolysing)
LQHRVQEIRELGWKRALARGRWEFKTHTGLIKLTEAARNPDIHAGSESITTLPAPSVDPREVAEAVRPLLSAEAVSQLKSTASQAARGRILCFSRWIGDFGNPIDWHCNPVNRRRWPADVHWSKVLRHEASVGDVKLTWEAARFPHAFYMARAAAFHPGAAPELAAAFFDQIDGFIASNPAAMGVNWNSGQEIVLRLIAWSFALRIFQCLGYAPDHTLAETIQCHLDACAAHLARHIPYARDSVWNNHLISEALGLYLLGLARPNDDAGVRLMSEGLSLLEQQADIQFSSDGSYLMHSHNYHRAVLQEYLWAMACTVAAGKECPPSWRSCLERSLDFLVAQQNPSDGRLPNFGANDGSLPLPLTTCDFADFRPVLQAISVATRGERIYRPGPWDEMAAWLSGPGVLELPMRQPERKSVSFTPGGYHVLRGRDSGSYATFRCGDTTGRFAQIELLHLDLWWRGHNVLVDAGSYLYNGPQPWHEHFLRTASHNTVQVDGLDQMLHLRRFKNIYPPRARLLRFEDHPEWALCEGEHDGFQRLGGRCVHRRSVLLVKDEFWIVVDRIQGDGRHTVRLHWLGGDYPFRKQSDGARLALDTPDGLFTISTFDVAGAPCRGDVVSGQETPPRGWLSRYYGEKTAVPSFAVERNGQLPLTIVSVLCPGVPDVAVSESEWTVAAGDVAARFTLTGLTLDPAGIHVFSYVTAG